MSTHQYTKDPNEFSKILAEVKRLHELHPKERCRLHIVRGWKEVPMIYNYLNETFQTML